MKKFITILAVVLFTAVSFQLKAQDFSGILKASTTLTNAATDSVVIDISGSRSAVGFGYGITKTSGTVAGTILLQYKLTKLASEGWKTWHTYTLKDATRDTAINLNYNPAVRWKVLTTTTGTQVSVHRKFLIYRK